MPIIQPGYVALGCELPLLRVAGLGERDVPCLRKLGASNKTHGVAKSIALGIIDV
jgi:hypothetical protein